MGSQLAPSARHVAHVLAAHADADGGNCFPSQRTIAASTGYTRQTTLTHLLTLENAGWIRRYSRGRGGLGWRRTAYHLLIPPKSECEVVLLLDQPRGAKVAHSVDQPIEGGLMARHGVDYSVGLTGPETGVVVGRRAGKAGGQGDASSRKAADTLTADDLEAF